MLKAIKFKILPGLLLTTLLSHSVFAEKSDPVQRDDFMFAAELDNAEASLRCLPLSADILQHLQTTAVTDVRVFDANGQVVPALIRTVGRQVDVSEHVLNFFPLYGNEAKDVRVNSTDVQRDDSGLVVAIHSRQSQADNKNILTGYVIDQTAYDKEYLSELEFEWPNNNKQVMVSLRIETSSDLTQWSTLERAAVIAHFQIDEQVMRRNVIKLSTKAQRYLRLTLLNPVEDFALEKITARYNTPGKTDYSWLSPGQLEAVEVNGREQYEFVMPGRVVPALLKFGFSENNFALRGYANSLISGQLYSLTAQHKWVARRTITQYRIVLAEGELESDPIRLGSLSDRRWRFEPADNRRILPADLPSVELAYPKYELIFMAQGPAPFTVAWGHAGLKKQTSSLNVILSAASPDDIVEVGIYEAEQLAQVPIAVDENYINWRKWLLFAVLVVAVLGAGRMAYQLLKEMKDETGSDQD